MKLNSDWLPIYYKWFHLEATQAEMKLPDYWVKFNTGEKSN